MNPDPLTSLLAAGAPRDAERKTDCPDEHAIAGYVDGGLDDVERARIERHLAGCDGCVELVGLLCRERRAALVEPVPDGVLAQARALVKQDASRRWRPAPAWATAAALVLAVPLLMQLGRNLERGPEGQGRPEPSATRTVTPGGSGLQVLSPVAGTSIASRQLSFRWTEVPGTPFYDVRIVTDAGDLVIQERVAGTTWRPPAQLGLEPGAEYFVHVDAYPSGDKAVSSDHVPFRVSR